MLRKFSLVLVMSTFFVLAYAQSSQSAFYWIRIYDQRAIGQKFSLHTELDNRRSFNPDKQRQFITHLHFHYKLSSKNNISQGISYSRVVNSNGLAVPELRLFNEFIGDQTLISKLSFQYRFRFEERFIRTIRNRTELDNGYDFFLRSRYRIQLSYAVSTLVSLKISDEIMFITTKNNLWYFDQNRLYVGIQTLLNRKFSAELGYVMLQQTQNKKQSNSNIFRVTLYHHVAYL